MSKNTIKINGEKLRADLSRVTGKNLYEISEENGFSRNFLSQACRSGVCSPITQAILKKYSLDPKDYEIKEKVEEISSRDNDPILNMTYGELRALVRSELKEAVYELCQEDQRRRKEEALRRCIQ